MRHFRMSNQNIKNLTTFKKHIGSILNEINKFDEADKNEAITYLKKCINSDKKTNNTSTPESSGLRKGKKKTNTNEHDKKTQTIRKSRRIKNNTFVKKLVLRCKLCDTKKRSIINFLKHLNTHIGTPISCRNCKEHFNGRISFDFHNSNVCGKAFTIKKTFKCNECGREFKYKRHLFSHMEGHKRNNCKYCDMRFTNKKYLIKHLFERHALKSAHAYYKCDHCDKKYVQKRSLYGHLQRHHLGKYVCTDCGTVIDDSDDYKKHIDMHDEAKKWECTQCKIRFVRRQHLLIHLKKHDMYKCITCNATFSSKVKVIEHKRRGHVVGGLDPKMMCPYCPKVYYRSFTLQQHLKKHNENNSSLYCKHCEKTFNTRYHYYKHCLTITHEKNCPDINQSLCDICGKKFTKKYLLDDHVYRSHSKKDLFSCTYCDYKTTNKTNMKRHNTIHMPSENYICESCGKNFSNIFSLKEHVSYSHIQVKQFQCDECDKKFKRKSELTRHKKIHSDERPYVCEICSSSYKRSNHLKRHKQNVHKIREEKRTLRHTKEMSVLNNQSENACSIPDADIIDISKNIAEIDPSFWGHKTPDSFNQFNSIQPQIYSVNIQEVDQLVASYIPEKQNYYPEYNINFGNVVDLDVIATQNNSASDLIVD